MASKTARNAYTNKVRRGHQGLVLSRTGFFFALLLVVSLQLVISAEISSHGAVCNSECAAHGSTSYYWCSTTPTSEYDKKSDYCSPAKGKDYRNYNCAAKCDKHDTKYYWCWLENRSWGYCSPTNTEQQSFTSNAGGNSYLGYNRTTSHGLNCQGRCEKQGKGYTWCYTVGQIDGDKWDYCSPYDGVDNYSRKCHTHCDYSGERYKWCYIGTGNNWGYCS